VFQQHGFLQAFTCFFTTNPNSEPYIGMRVHWFFKGAYFAGEVTRGPEERFDPEVGSPCECWHVKYDDGDEADWERHELYLQWDGRNSILDAHT